MPVVPETRYARAGDVHIAYQVVGSGPIDLVYVPPQLQQVEHLWEEPRVAAFFERIVRFSRLILFDRRGTGMSDPIASATTLEDQMEDVSAVLDAVGSRQAALFAQSEGAAMAMLYAATHPERTCAQGRAGDVAAVGGGRRGAGVTATEIPPAGGDLPPAGSGVQE